MSIALGFVGVDGILLATDSRMLIGVGERVEFEDNHSQKLWKLSDNIGLTSIGAQHGYRQYLVDICQKKLLDEGTKECDIATFRLLKDVIKDDFMQQLEKYDSALTKELLRFNLAIMIAGYCKDLRPYILNIETYVSSSNIPFILDLRDLYCVHGISFIPEYWIAKMDIISKLKEGLNIDALKKLAIFLINETKISNSHYIGGDIQMATITKEEGFKFIDSREVMGMQSKIEKIINPKRILKSIC